MTADKIWVLVRQGFLDTLYMTIPSTLLAYLIGLPLGVLLVITKKGGIKEMPTFNKVLGVVINFLRSVPFLILLVMLFPITRVVMGTSVGTRSIIFTLFVFEISRALTEIMATALVLSWALPTKVSPSYTFSTALRDVPPDFTSALTAVTLVTLKE